MLGQSLVYMGTRHQIGYRVGFTTAKLLKIPENIENLGAIGPRSPIFSGIGHFFGV